MSMFDTAFHPLRGHLHVAAPSSLDLITPYVLSEQHDWFEDEIRFVRRLITPGACAIDVGANYGVYALTMARLSGPAGLVLGFEPAAATMACLRQSAERNGLGNLALVQAALSDHAGTAELQTGAHAELSHLARPGGPGAPAGQRTEVVPLHTLDQLLRDGGDLPALGGRPVDFIKLDAEGEEARILAGGARFLTEHSPLVMFEMKHGQTVDLGLCHAFARLGYEPYRLLPGPGLLVPADPEAAPDPFQLNLFACKPERALALERRGLLARDTPPSSALAPVDGRLWEVLLDGLAYAAAPLFDTWAACAGTHPEPALYLSALGHYARAQLFAHEPPGHRHRALLDALDAARAAAAAHPGPARLQTLARVAADLGLRALAVETLDRLCQQLTSGGAPRADEPFLPVAARLDGVDPRGQLGAFCLAGALEQREKLRAFSSFYTGQSGLGAMLLAQRLAEPVPGLLDPEIGRRVQLIRRRFGE